MERSSKRGTRTSKGTDLRASFLPQGLSTRSRWLGKKVQEDPEARHWQAQGPLAGGGITGGETLRQDSYSAQSDRLTRARLEPTDHCKTTFCTQRDPLSWYSKV